MVQCKHFWESNFGDHICSQSGSFCCIDKSRCEICEAAEDGLPSPEMGRQFIDWNRKYTKRREDAEYYYSRSLDFSCGLKRLNQLQKDGKQNDVAALRVELLEEYRMDGLIDLVLEEGRWKSVIQ